LRRNCEIGGCVPPMNAPMLQNFAPMDALALGVIIGIGSEEESQAIPTPPIGDGHSFPDKKADGWGSNYNIKRRRKMLYSEALQIAKELDRQLTQEFAASTEAGGNYHQWIGVGFRYYDPEDGISFMSSHWPAQPPEAIWHSACGDGSVYYAEPGHGAALIQRMWDNRHEGEIQRGLIFKFIEPRNARW
jgi:hypothetical protein